MSRFRVLVTDYAWPDLAVEEQILAAADAELVVAADDDASMIQTASEVDAILTCWRQVPVAALQAASRCRIVSRYGIGLDNIPVAEATRLGMVVTNVPDYCLDEVADHTMALLLACARRVVPFTVAGAQGIWNIELGRSIQRLRRQTLGLVGYGNVARRVARRAQAFGLKILAYTPRLRDEDVDAGIEATQDLEMVLRQADYLSLHVPLTPETHGLIDGDALRSMQPSAYLINTARGAVVDETALLSALAEGVIAGAAVDVLVDEPPRPDHPLLGLDNVITTPHTAFYSQDAILELTSRAAQHVASVLQGDIPSCVVNPAVLDQPNCRLRQSEVR